VLATGSAVLMAVLMAVPFRAMSPTVLMRLSFLASARVNVSEAEACVACLADSATTPTSRVQSFSYLTLQPFGRGSSIRSPSAVVLDGTMNVTNKTASPLLLLRTSSGLS
jgi:hypothetical protein